MQNSGKLLILGIVALAVLMAGASWWFRYRATHRAVEFWGPEAARLIRDGPKVTLRDLQSNAHGAEANISKAPGLTHLRYALLEDRSFEWGTANSLRRHIVAPRWQLTFSDTTDGQQVTIEFSDDCRLAQVATDDKNAGAISCSPIAAGLTQIFTEYSAVPPAAAR